MYIALVGRNNADISLTEAYLRHNNLLVAKMLTSRECETARANNAFILLITSEIAPIKSDFEWNDFDSVVFDNHREFDLLQDLALVVKVLKQRGGYELPPEKSSVLRFEPVVSTAQLCLFDKVSSLVA